MFWFCRFPGIFQNELVYDLLWDMAFRSEPIADMYAWTAEYVRRRYALPESGFKTIYAAYDILLATVYNCTRGDWGVTKGFVELTPSLQMNNSGFMPTTIWYDNAQLESAVSLMLQAADSMRLGRAVGRERYQYDVIDFTKQWMSNILIGYHAQLVGAYNQKDNATLVVVGATILSLIEDWDALLNTNVHFLLGPWIRDARQWGETVEEQDWLEFNARNQITLWGPTGEIADYASKVRHTAQQHATHTSGLRETRYLTCSYLPPIVCPCCVSLSHYSAMGRSDVGLLFATLASVHCRAHCGGPGGARVGRGDIRRGEASEGTAVATQQREVPRHAARRHAAVRALCHYKVSRRKAAMRQRGITE